MKKIFIVGNWKANKTVPQTQEWLRIFAQGVAKQAIPPEKTVILCPPLTLLSEVARIVREQKIPLSIGSQNVSLFPVGAFTGEVTATHVKEFASYVIIGHTERRMHFHEDFAVLSEKVRRTVDAGLKPIYCVQDIEIPIVEGIEIIAYEPASAIGSGKPDTPENASNIAKAIKEKMRTPVAMLYGGSVTADNVKSFTTLDTIDGVLVGGSSLDPKSFLTIVKNA